MTLDIDSSRLKNLAITADFVPLGFFEKKLLQDFDLRDERNKALSVVSRARDSDVAMEVLLSTVCTAAGSRVTPSPRIEKLLHARAFAMYDEFDNPVLDSTTAFLCWLNAELSTDGTAVEKEWLERAWVSSDFRTYFDLLATHFIMLAQTQFDTDRILKIRRVAVSQESAGRQASLLHPSSGGFVLDLTDFGWPLSEHLRLIAPDETYIADVVMFPSQPSQGDDMQFETAGTPERPILYSHDSSASAALLYGQILPARGGYLFPAVVLSWMASVVLLGGAAAEYFTQRHQCGMKPRTGWLLGPIQTACESQAYLSGMGSSLNSAVTLGFVAPTILLAYALRQGEPEIRRGLLQSWRIVSICSLGLTWLAMALLLSNEWLKTPWLLWESWTVLGLLSLLISIRQTLVYGRLMRAARKREFGVVTVTLVNDDER